MRRLMVALAVVVLVLVIVGPVAAKPASRSVGVVSGNFTWFGLEWGITVNARGDVAGATGKVLWTAYAADGTFESWRKYSVVGLYTEGNSGAVLLMQETANSGNQPIDPNYYPLVLIDGGKTGGVINEWMHYPVGPGWQEADYASALEGYYLGAYEDTQYGFEGKLSIR